ncbi:MAG: HNH endonuclease [Chitinivibrionia bacterium]|nr:HNH endonuclease [Chitinivibrionia bacterium]
MTETQRTVNANNFVIAKKEINKQSLSDVIEDAKFIFEVDGLPETTDIEIPDTPCPPAEKAENNPTGYKRDPKISKKALACANYKCELCEKEERLFLKKNGNNYTEPHHLIPISYQGSFEKGLDNLANIVSLCSYCHNFLHYGRFEDKKISLKKLFERREKRLGVAKIDIKPDELLGLYK